MREESRLARFYRVIIPKLTSLGAAIVVFGALMKIEHYPGAGIFLGIGLITESIIFFIGTFEPAAHFNPHYEWEKVHPELQSGEAKKRDSKGKGLLALGAIDKMLMESNLDVNTMKKFGQGMVKLESTASQMKDVGNAVSASNTYAKSLQDASGSVAKFSKTLDDSGKSFNALSSVQNVAKSFQDYEKEVNTNTDEMKKSATNLGALNAIYEMELKKTDSHLKSMNKYYGSLRSAMESMGTVSNDAQSISKEMGKLSGNLSTLNKVYGNMLSAMKS